MDIKSLLKKSRQIWKTKKCSLPEIVIRLGKIFGDICRVARNEPKDQEVAQDEKELKKELGNVIFSTIRWCDDLGFDPEECIDLAIEAQEKYPKK